MAPSTQAASQAQPQAPQTAPTTTSSSPLNLTFGIELEFLCIFPAHVFDTCVPDISKYYGPLNDKHRAHHVEQGICAGQAIYCRLLQRKIPVTGFEALEDDDDDLNDDAVHPSYSRWLIKDDESLELTFDEEWAVPANWRIEKIEIASRKFRLADAYGEKGWLAEIKLLLDTIFELENLGCRMITNRTTGMHMHVGNETRNNGTTPSPLPLATCKKIYQLGTALAPVIDRLHATSRIKEGPHDYPACLAPSYFHRRNGRTARGANVFDWLASIETATTYRELVLLIQEPGFGDLGHTGHNCAYNFDNTCENPEYPGSKVSGTVEFRQHLGTLDFNTIVAWVGVVTSFVGFCHEAGDEDFVALCAMGVDPKVSVETFGRAIGLSEQFIGHYTGTGELPSLLLSNTTYAPNVELRRQIDQVIEINDLGAEHLFDEELVEQAIREKWRNGEYGTDKTITDIRVLPDVVASSVRMAQTVVDLSDVADSSAEDKASLARAETFRELSLQYVDPAAVGYWELPRALEIVKATQTIVDRTR